MVIEPRLLVVDGPQAGVTVRLEDTASLGAADGRFTFGRQTSSSLQLLEPAVSRLHAEIRQESGGFVLRDLGSRLGTFVNGLPIEERPLEHGDLIQIGGTSVLFLLYGSSEAGILPLSDSQLLVESTIQLETGSARYLQPALRTARPAGQEDSAADLQVLLELSRTVHEQEDVATLCRQLLDLLPEVLPPARAAVLLVEAGEAAPQVVASRLPPGDGGPFAPSRTAIERVLSDAAGLLSADVRFEAGLEAAESLRQGAVRSVLAAPLRGRDRLHGVLYFEGTQAGAFAASHLELVTAAAAIAGLALDTARRVQRLEQENRRLREEAQVHGMVGESAAMKRFVQVLEKVARAESTILLRGESGTGKELASRALHRSSPRAEGPFVALNCATLSEALLESELFGHEKGAFTGAVSRKLGKMEIAHGGTLLLDEVAEVPVTLQAKLLRALQEREIERLGGQRPIPVDVRVVAATHQDLEAALREGRFREDLFYRLNVISLTLPPLRERREDVGLLVRHFARHHGERLGLGAVSLADDAHRALMAYDWPGNVRQLANAVERALVLGDGEVIRLEDLPEEILDGTAAEVALGDFQTAILETKKRLLLDALAASEGNAAEAARRLGLHPNSLRRLVRQLGLRDFEG